MHLGELVRQLARRRQRFDPPGMVVLPVLGAREEVGLAENADQAAVRS